MEILNGKTAILDDGTQGKIILVTRVAKRSGKTFCKFWAQNEAGKLIALDQRKVIAARKRERKEEQKDKESLVSKEDKARIKKIAEAINIKPEDIKPITNTKVNAALQEVSDALSGKTIIVTGLRMADLRKAGAKVLKQDDESILVSLNNILYKRVY